MHPHNLVICLALISPLMSGAALAQAHDMAMSGPLATLVQDANQRFEDVNAAIMEGYGPIPCVSGPTGGSMGIHYVNGEYLNDGVIDVSKPEAVMYEPQPDGSLELIGVEYITFTGPANLEGHLFNFVGAPNRYGLDPFYELHVWAWRHNPSGTFTDMNPDVSCEATPLASN